MLKPFLFMLFAAILLVAGYTVATVSSSAYPVSAANLSGDDIKGGTPTASPTPLVCGPYWQLATPPDVDAFLFGVDAISSTNVWAVGISGPGNIVEHWNGTNWSIVSSPNPGSGRLEDVWAFAPDDIWAVGRFGGSPGQTLTMHWDGTAWTVIPSPNAGTKGSELHAVYGVASNDVWAVGQSSFNSGQAFAMHWDGAAWTLASTPPTSTIALYGVSAIASNDVWAVGTQAVSGGQATFTMHWNGTAWTTISSPNPVDGGGLLVDVAHLASNDVWALGRNYYDMFVLHWNGTQWTMDLFPVPNVTNPVPFSIDILSDNDVWVVGTDLGFQQSIIMHWNGDSWTRVPAPYTTEFGNYTIGVTAVSPEDVWAVGVNYTLQGNRPLIIHYSDPQLPCVTATPTSTRTATSIPTQTSTSTSTPTITPTPTACTIQYADVPSESTFYSFVRCLACRGITNGYPCGSPGEPCNGNNDPYFRSNNNVTRGQIAKIVILSAQYNIPVSGQDFEDVPPGSTFYNYVEQLYYIGAMSGYACGNPEPCVEPFNRPYFRPNANASRGQLAKIVSNAAGFTDPPASQTFEDVPEGSTFYFWVERLASRGAMSGYACGNPEPCVLPLNRPYFRPGNNVTRGQTAKITANTFYPDCYTPFKP